MVVVLQLNQGEKQIAICGHLDPWVFLQEVVSEIGLFPVQLRVPNVVNMWFASCGSNVVSSRGCEAQGEVFSHSSDCESIIVVRHGTQNAYKSNAVKPR